MVKKKGVAYWDKKLIGNGGILNTYVKYRDAIMFTPEGKPIAECITCGKEVSGHSLHAGHFIGRRHKKAAYDERNINGQCAGCNKWGKGEVLKYRKALIEMYGKPVVEELEQAQYSSGKHWTPVQLEEKYNYYKEMVKEYKDHAKN
jgi:hypothetical protein